jgi:hypothetical protein
MVSSVSKTKNDGRSEVLVEFDQIRTILSATHAEIPALLLREHELAHAWSSKDDELTRTQAEENHRLKQAAIRRRASSIERIVALEPRLRAERERVAGALDQYAETAITEFSRRYSAVIGQLQSLWEEGRLLAAKVGQDVDMPLPVTMVPGFDGTARPQPVRADVAPQIDPQIVELAGKVNEVDAALRLIASIRHSRRLDADEFELARSRGLPTEIAGTFVVTKPFTCTLDGEQYVVGDLISSDLVGLGHMQRSVRGKGFVRPASLPVSLPAA